MGSGIHITNDFYENSQLYDNERPDTEDCSKKYACDSERQFQYLKPVLPKCRLLDFGCEIGGFLLKAREFTKIAHGVELETCLSSYYQSHGLTVFRNLSDIPKDIRRKGYDIITMFHVLEHLPDPKLLLSQLGKILAHGGQIIVEVPNADYNTPQISYQWLR